MAPEVLDRYFTELGKVGLLTAEDEVRLAQRIEAGRAAEAALHEAPQERRAVLQQAVAGGREAFDQFVSANLRLVVSIAAQYSRRTRMLDLDELIQEGNLGLIRAVEKFEWRRGLKFSTYATWWIKQAVQRGIAGNERTIRLPVGVHDALVKVRAATARITAETGREPTIDELAAATRLTPDRIQHARDVDHRVDSLDRPVGHEPDAAQAGDLLAVADDAPADEVADQLLIDQLLAVAERHLEPRAWYVLQRRYGLGGLEAATLREIGQELGLSRERVRRIEMEALATLRADVALAA